MFCFVILFIIMAGFGFDNDDFSLSGLHKKDMILLQLLIVPLLLMMKIMMVYWNVLTS